MAPPPRVVHQLQGERSFHIFYQLIRGATAQEREAFALPQDPQAFRYLSRSGCTVSVGGRAVPEGNEGRGRCLRVEGSA